MLDSVYLTKDILELALRSSVDPLTHEELTTHIVKLRHTFREELDKAGLSNLVVPFEPDRYNIEATVGENLLFGTAIGEQLVGRAIGRCLADTPGLAGVGLVGALRSIHLVALGLRPVLDLIAVAPGPQASGKQ